jgi:predicted ribosome quality control (RQC) complex YloA/Tae2 family protein
MKRTRPNLATSQRLTKALSEMLEGYRIDRIWRPTQQQLLIRFRPGGCGRLLIDLAPETVRVTTIDKWPDMPSRPDQTTLRFRQAVENARIAAIRHEDDRRMIIELSTKTGPHRVAIQLAGRYPNISVWDVEDVEIVRLLPKRPPIDRDSPSLLGGPCWGPDIDEANWLEAYQTHLRELAEAIRFNQESRVTIRAIRSCKKRVQRRNEALTKDMTRAENAQECQRLGELLKPMVSRIAKGTKEIDVPDYHQEGTPLVRIPLDPKLDGVGNMEAFFRRYRKYHTALPGIQTRLMETRGELRQAESLLAHLMDLQAGVTGDETAPVPWTELEQIQKNVRLRLGKSLRRPTSSPTSRKHQETQVCYRRFYAIDGSEILVGRNAKDNDVLTFKVARGSDLWFHARDVSGAHVILRTTKGQEPSSEVMLDAAILAMWHSSARKEKNAEILWSPKKHVRKPKGSQQGRVTVAGGKTLWVREDEARIARLYRSARDSDIL